MSGSVLLRYQIRRWLAVFVAFAFVAQVLHLSDPSQTGADLSIVQADHQHAKMRCYILKAVHGLPCTLRYQD